MYTSKTLVLVFAVHICLTSVVSAWQWGVMLRSLHLLPVPSSDTDAQRNKATTVPNIAVIGAGLPRSGTDSLREALEVLGYHTYHARFVASEGHQKVWNDLLEDNVQRPDHDNSHSTEIMEDIVQALANAGYTATTDFPSCFVFAELAQRFPDAKVILSVRDSADTWADSYRATIGTLTGQSTRKPFSYFLREISGPFAQYTDKQLGYTVQYTTNRRPTHASLVKAYNRWIQHVQDTIPAHRLLVHNFEDGWEPLCQFLDIAHCPIDQPYPENNSRSSWKLIVAIICAITDFWPFILVIPMAFLILVVRCLIWLWSAREPPKSNDRDKKDK